MERKIGEIFEYNGEWYQCIVGNGCKNCAFNERKCYTFTDNNDPIGDCCAERRTDKYSVIFKKLEKVGEPFERNGYMYQEYKAHTYPLLMSGGAKIPTYNGFAVIIKQNKEDMEDNKLNLKPFDLEAAKSGKPVCTRDGRKARIICFDRIDSTGFNLPIVALIQCEETEVLQLYRDDGKRNVKVDLALDLMMLPEKKEGWVNVYKDSVYDTKSEALIGRSGNGYIDTIKVEWEE